MSTESEHVDRLQGDEVSGEILDEQVRRVYERFAAIDKSFRRLFNTFVVLAVALFFFLFYPYVSVQGQKKRILNDRQRTSAEIAELAEAGAALEKALGVLRDQRQHAHMDGVRTVAFDFHEGLWQSAKQQEQDLRQLKEQLVERGFDGAAAWTVGSEPSPTLLSNLGQHREFTRFVNLPHPCLWEIGERWVRCKIRRELRRLHDGVVAALRVSESTESPHLSAELNDLHDSVYGGVDQNTGTDAMSSLRLHASFYWKDYLATLDHTIKTQEQRGQALKVSQDERATRLEALNAAIVDAEAQLTDLQRFDRIDTPVGTLPVGLNKIILIFPLLVGLGSYLLASTFCETLRLRQILRSLHQRKAVGHVLTDHQIALIAPLWLDPADPVQGRSIRYLLLLTAPALILAAIGVLLSNGLLGDEFLQQPLAARIAYLLFHLLGLGLSMTGLVQIFRAFRRPCT